MKHGAERGLTWDLAAATHAIGFFPAILRLNGGQFEGLPFDLQPSQQFIIGSLFGWKGPDGTRRFRRLYWETAKGQGKALALDTPIPTPSGWTTMGELKAGDSVLDEAGCPCLVTAATEVMHERPCYSVEFDDGAKIVADAEHLWLTEMRHSDQPSAGAALKGVKRNERGVWRHRLRTTAEIAATLRYKNGKYQSANHSVALTRPLALPDTELPVPPYVLGAWLGDGDTDSARITIATDDWQIAEEIQAEGETTKEQAKHAPHIGRLSLCGGGQGDCSPAKRDILRAALETDIVSSGSIAAETGRDREKIAEFMSRSGYFEQVERHRGLGNGGGTIGATWRLRHDRREDATAIVQSKEPMTVRLKALGLLGNKHVPAAYLRASIPQRVALLQGLMDTDGTIDTKGTCEFTTTLEALADGITDLLYSLGIKPWVCTGRATLYGMDCGQKWRVAFTPAKDMPAFRLQRKADRQFKRHDRRALSGDRRIVECRPVESVPVKCIAVDSPSSMYLAGRQMVPTHNSPVLGGLGLLLLVADGEPRAEIYAAGSRKDQAMVLFRDAVAMVDQSPRLAGRLTKSGVSPVWNLADVRTGSFFRPIAADTTSKRGQSGPRPSGALCDEVHEHPTRLIIDMLEAGFKSRRQPLLAMATNAGSDKKSVCGQEHDHAVKVAAGTRTPDDDFTYVGEVLDDTTFAFVCALDKDDDPLEDPTCWPKANPLLGVTVTEKYLADLVAQAKAIPGKLNTTLRLHFCKWTDSDEAWLPQSVVRDVLADFDPEVEHAGADVYLGADLSGTQDLTAVAKVVRTGFVERTRDDGSTVQLPTYDAWVDSWTPRDTMRERALKDNAPYDVWVDQGHLHAEDGKTIRLDFIAAHIGEVNSAFRIVTLAYDRYAYRRLAENLDEQGLTINQVEHPQGGKRRAKASEEAIEAARDAGEDPPQGLWMPGSLLELENLILEGRLRIRRNPVVVSAIMSAAIERDPFDNRWFSKRRAVNRIDPLIALAMAVGAATGGAPDDIGGGSIWDRPELWDFSPPSSARPVGAPAPV